MEYEICLSSSPESQSLYKNISLQISVAICDMFTFQPPFLSGKDEEKA